MRITRPSKKRYKERIIRIEEVLCAKCNKDITQCECEDGFFLTAEEPEDE